jgi:hypothetical protein
VCELGVPLHAHCTHTMSTMRQRSSAISTQSNNSNSMFYNVSRHCRMYVVVLLLCHAV